MDTKNYAVEVKAVGEADGLSDGEFEAIVAAWNVDSYGDRIVKGAFAEDITSWSGDSPMPIVWSHRWDDPFAHIGRVLAVEERDDGLWIRGVIEDIAENKTAAQVHRLLKGRRIRQFSFAFDVLESAEQKQDGETINELRKLKVYEVGPCLVGVNQETALLSAKAAHMAKAARVLSDADYDELVAARDSLSAAIGAAAGDDESDDSPTEEAHDGGHTQKTSGLSGPAETDEASQPAELEASASPTGEASAIKSGMGSAMAQAVVTINTLERSAS
ncbi:HK97 family phage prohead protease [Naumannella halotolerans]|uniref:Prohead serine protease domain-containing protein n=1 Tax=Naumannella halotolerans TaxID=993414 RepID=A0A4R7J435_9ACTN|nr:HK97 family phage prohead protease [Naumannella halotolerans]TDT31107.1 hypothetical protein CLV29_2520 [Naumannella halotolerans]